MNNDEQYIGWFIDWIEEWSQFFRRDNWYTFRPVLIEFEDDRIMGGLEFTFVILGLGFRLRWNYVETEEVTNLRKRLEELDL